MDLSRAMKSATNPHAQAVWIFLPTLFWFCGLLEFLSHTLLARPTAVTSGWSVWLTVLLACWAGVKIFRRPDERMKEPMRWWLASLKESPLLLKGALLATGGILVLALLEARLPPHLEHEYDAINYHMGLAKQHLLQGGLRHLWWSAADLWPMPIQWGLAPFWFSSQTHHKLPQFIAALWALGLLLALSRRSEQRSEQPGYLTWIPVLAFASTQGVMFQLGTAMMDLTILYFLLAFLYALRRDRPCWAALHLAVFASSKAFMPVQAAAIALFGLGFYWLKDRHACRAFIRKQAIMLMLACAFTLILLSRTLWVSLERAGTPLFPFATCLISSVAGCQGRAGEVIRESAARHLQSRDDYGQGRGMGAFLRHLWAVAVPSKSNKFNNEYDYALGLGWLLWVVLLVASVPRWIKQRAIPFVVVVAIGFWITWWLGSHQSRWLYPVMALGWIGTTEAQQRINPHLLAGVLFVSALVSLQSQWGILSPELWKSPALIEKEQAAKIRRDLQTGIFLSVESLYVDQPIQEMAPGSLRWSLAE
jgi:hypothetical protein